MVYRYGFKRVLDIGLAGTALLVLFPFMLLVALGIYLEDKGPVLFRQTRVGRNGDTFQFLKFRSMPVNTKDLPSAQASDLAITRMGKWIRRTNIDELPQILNILRNDMSIVGPRPALPSQTTLCAMRDKHGAMACKPGLTGLAQIQAYDGMPESEKAEWDGKYALEITLWGDLVIIFKTFAYLAKRPPVY